MKNSRNKYFKLIVRSNTHSWFYKIQMAEVHMFGDLKSQRRHMCQQNNLRKEGSVIHKPLILQDLNKQQDLQ